MKNYIAILLVASLGLAKAAMFTVTMVAGTYTTAQMQTLFNAACATGDCIGADATDAISIIIPNGVTVNVSNPSWSFGNPPNHYPYLFFIIQGTTGRLNFGTHSMGLSETSGIVVENTSNTTALGSSPGASPKINFRNAAGAVVQTYTTTNLPTIVSNGGVSGTGGYGNPLPVELIYFTGKYDSGHTELDWATATEKDNDYFVVEQSVDGYTFEPIQEISGVGNSLEKVEYATTVSTPNHSTLMYYRLIQVDFNGESTILPTIAVAIESYGKSSSIHIIPNPAKSYIKLVKSGIIAEQVVNYEIFNAIGRVVKTGNTGFGEELSLSDLESGQYGIRIVSTSEATTISFLVD